MVKNTHFPRSSMNAIPSITYIILILDVQRDIDSTRDEVISSVNERVTLLRIFLDWIPSKAFLLFSPTVPPPPSPSPLHLLYWSIREPPSVNLPLNEKINRPTSPNV